MRPSSSNQFLRFAAPAGLVCFVSCFSQANAAGTPATPATLVGDTITDPNTGADVTVTSLIKYKDAGLTAADGVDPEGVVYVVTNTNKAILARTADNAVIFKVDPATGNPILDSNNKGILFQVKTRTVDATTTLVTGVTVYPNGGDMAATSSQNASFAVVTPPADPPNPPETPALGSSGPVSLVWKGAGGSNGHVGAIFVPAGDGGDGANGPANIQTIAASYGNITATNVPGIRIASIGGDGGKGGDSYVNLAGGGGDGGYGGSGGTVNLTNHVDLTVTGNNSSGIQAYSQSGRGGVGGDGVLALGGGGTGGLSRNGGTVIVNNLGNISTDGSRSHGISALSSGGTAGSGGNSFGLVGVGGSGSRAGNGGSVSVTNSGSITTRGLASHGILAQSIGGTGGDGGIGGGLVAFSGDGSTGGTGGSVTVNLNAGSNIATFGGLSSGVVAQSIGGGGGDSGASGGIAAFGAKGGAGNDGGIVTVNSATGTSITTDGNFSSGIVAQSIGGGGGSGGFTGGLVALNLGGSNSGGGAGKMVTVQNGGSITTSGLFSRGIFAQSIGGGGGAAGDSGGLVALGGKGGAGGASGKVIVGNSGVITTDGVFSQGIFAQSIAGGGGSGGDAGGLVSIGGSSTTGANSETVTVTNTGSIITKQGRSDAILAQSIGGGGGNAGSGVGVVAIGGSGASAVGGNANTVTVSNLGAISTTGMDSRGIFAQAVGGGGGNGGAGTAGGVFVGFSLGGNGGAGGDGGKVSISLDQSGALPALSQSSIQTTGDRSVGILAQSVGGGGGSGGDSITGTVGVYGSVSVAIGGDGAAGGEGGEVELSGTGRVTTAGDMAHGVLLESVGGGGGNGGMSVAAALALGDVAAAAVTVSLGGGAGPGGDGGTVTVTDANMIIHTGGLQSTGFIAQSVGGGGGSGGMAISAAAAASAGASGAFSVGLGGDGEAGGVGGVVNVTLGGSVTTTKDQSDGILIQSVGGGGGNGGMTVAGSLGVGAGAAGAISVGIGGSGSGGGNAGAVTANITSDIDTNGDGSDGLIVQAVGGGGGNGGLSVAAGLAGAGVGAGSVTLGIGGSGAGGGTGNVVNATYAGTVITRGGHSTGILAQSVGGGGGNGGGAVSANLNGAGTGAGGVALGLGGKGDGGGDGGAAGIDLAVRLVTSGQVTTLGEGSSAIVAQSIGGGGGNGGFSVAAVGSGAGTGAGSVSVGLGGAGGGGGSGKRVEAVINSIVNTFSDNSGGVLAQSVGGGGGNGGFNVSASGAGAGTGSGAVAVGLGGNGGTAGLGGSVDATSTGTITTRGANSSGFVAQSIGGGGGNGGFNVSGTISGAGTGSGAVSVGLGGGGAGGGNAGAVVARTSADVVTLGNSSIGIMAQSVGGGGGNGGFNVSATLSGAGTGSGAVGVGLGGNGGGGGDGSTVDLTVNNDVFTGNSVSGLITGHDSSAVVAQSIGGGGGNGGFNVTVAGSAAGTGSGTVGVGIGGRGLGGGDGARVTSIMTGNISTIGDNANGLMVQSVGGGGGNGGFNVTASVSVAGTGSGAVGVGIGGSAGAGGNSGPVISSLTGNVTTLGKNATGVTAQSLGGGGGNGGFNVTGTIAGAGTGAGGVSVGIGGAGGSGGDSDTVDNTVIGDVTTLGDGSGGVLAQSLGGGGGNGGFNISGAIGGAGTGAGAVSVGIGGSGGDGGDSKAVTNSVTGNVGTAGKFATGVVAQSIGGGGGNGGFTVAGTIAGAGKGAGGVSVGIGGSGGGGGNSGTVNNTVIGNVTASEIGSGGILAQSLGGGGGNGGFSVSGAISVGGTGSGAVGVGIGGSGGMGGDAEKVTNIVTGDVFTSGNEGFGIAAQSIGGGGGNGGFNVTAAIGLAKDGAGAIGVGVGGMGGDGGDAGDVDNTVTGYVQTLGDNATGILAQSAGGGGGNGGFNVSGTITAAKTGSGGLAIGVGGFGGGGGLGKDVINTVTGGVVTSGNNSGGVIAQSFGGGGGNGGFNVTGALNFSKENGGALGIGVGGFGGDGGNSGNVTSTVTTTALHNQIGTIGDDSSAVVAQSIGGSGGNGGLNITGVVNLTGKNGAAVGVGVGGFGGGAGNSGNVLLNTQGELVTQGNNSNGILAQSIGGGGGSGGTNVTGTLAITTASGGSGKTLAASIGVGGFGGAGGDAGDVGVTYEGDITAIPRVWIPDSVDPLTGAITPAHYEIKEGIGSHGLAAQSIGGGGGDGGINVSAGISYASGQGDAYGLIVGIGGFGGGGGDAGNVNVDVTGGGTISSYGSAHSGIFAQSLGGGGGNGAINVSGGIVSDSPLIFGIGGFGADAGIAKDVTVNTVTDVLTSASDANGDINPSAGLLAQSLGGGGGNGGLNVSGGIAIAKEASVPSLTIGIGGFGGAGAISGNVIVNHTGNVTSSGNWVSGILAQSIAGGGGNGGMNVSGQINFADSESSGGKKDITIVAGVGGSGGTGADAGDVTITHDGIVITKGDNALGVAAQSIGGGGGNGGLNLTGVFAKRSSPIAVGVGGTGSGGGHAGNVLVNRGGILTPTGKITTDGDGSTGLEASSIGGGGGNAGMNLIGGYSKAGDDDTASGFAANIAIGGNGGEAGNGGTAGVNNFSDIETGQKNSHGILAQSIGGGGGNGNYNMAMTYASANDDNLGFNLAIGGAPGDGGTGAQVDVVQKGNIITHGNRSFGILAQSIGGGGGNVGVDSASTKNDGGSVSIILGRVGGTGGFASDVNLNFSGSILTEGVGSFGMLAQSIGNGGGNSSAITLTGESASDDDNPAKSIAVSIGLEGGSGGKAGNVNIIADGSVITMSSGAHAIFAQSVGGGGGNGGDADTTGETAATIGLSLGGTGGTGGTGGIVHVTSSASLRTHGDTSLGILAQSIGGGGGTGGVASAGGDSSKLDGITIAIGGTGGAGMAADQVIVENSGIILTSGLNSHGVLAQSLGGGGGNSGVTSNTIENDEAKESTTRVAISVGGTGGDGAVSGDVTVTNTGTIGTEKANSIGIFAQSIGGGGGNADTVTTNTVSGESGGNNISIGLGGSGGTGAAAGRVIVTNNLGQIFTMGDHSHGILAMSVGGGGGNGSTTVSTNKTGAETTDTSTNSYAFNIGGEGAIGGTGGEVIVSNGGSIVTRGIKAHGILAQSIGGGGGNGGMSVLGDAANGEKAGGSGDPTGTLRIGGKGGNGNVSGNVTVTNSGSIEVFGPGSFGIFAQSVGGGGGDGGFASSLSSNLVKNPKIDLDASLTEIAIGGNGGDGANSGNVLVTNTGTIISHGDKSYGIYAQSVGGGGGNVGHSHTSPAWMAADLVVSTLLGGRDGSKGTAGTVTVNTTGDILMLGKNSSAQFTQSVNGGGGNADLFLDVSRHAIAIGDNGVVLPDNGRAQDKVSAFLTSVIELGTEYSENGLGSAIESSHLGDLFTSGKGSAASLTQSIGGGGGNANSEIVVDSMATVKLDLALGGKNSTDNGGGDVTITRAGDVATTGANAQGLGVQSIGGGGGNAIVSVRKVSAPATPAVPAAGASAKAQLGSVAGMTSNGGNVLLNYKGDLVTIGSRATGLVVQSIGGGGGKLDLTGINKLNLALGGKGGSSGNGGNINLSNVGAIMTKGRFANGLILQSIGGGGGLVLTDRREDKIKLALNHDNSGNGGNITFDQKGNIVVSGKAATAVLAQSLGGGGGVLDRHFANTAGGAGISGAVSLKLDGNVLATGKDGIAVFAQSRAADGQGDILVKLTDSQLIYAGINGQGVHISGGADNRFVNRGTVMTADGLKGRTTIGREGNDVVNNSGVFYGQFKLGAGKNQFNNMRHGLLVSGPKLMLGGADNLLINAGTMMPGDMHFAQHAELTGGFVQTSKGLTFAELDFGTDKLDQIHMTGAAKLAGKMDVSLLNPQLVPSGHFRKYLYSADMGVTNDGMKLITAPSVVINYKLLYPNATDAVLDYNVDFSPSGALGRNLREVGDYFNRIQAVGSSPALADTVIELLYIPTFDAYRHALSQLGPDFYGEQQAEMLRSNQRFDDILADGGAFRFMDHDKLIWFNFETDSTTHDANGDYKKVDHSSDSAAMGFQKLLNKDWTAGAGISFEKNTADGYGGRWTSDGETMHLGAMAKRSFGATEVTGALSYSWNNTDTQRHGQLTDPFSTDASRDMQALAAMVRVGHQCNYGEAYLRPSLDLGLARLMVDGATETGAGATSLDLDSSDETHAWIRPTLKFGNVHAFNADLTLHLYAEVGVLYYLTDNHTDVSAGFVGAPTGVSPMVVPIDLGTYTHGTVGVELINAANASVGLEYGKVVDEDYDIDHWALRVNIPF